MGQVIITVTVANWVDRIMAERKFIPAEDVRSVTLDNVLVDTGATLLCLPAPIIQQLGLVQDGSTGVETTAGEVEGRIFRYVDLCIAERRGRFVCLELTAVDYALLGVTPMEALGLEPSLRDGTLRILPIDND